MTEIDNYGIEKRIPIIIEDSNHQEMVSFKEKFSILDELILISSEREGTTISCSATSFQQSQNHTNKHAMMCKINGIEHHLFTPQSWYVDSCVLYTVDNNDTGMCNIKQINKIVGGIGGNKIKATKIGKKKVLF